MEWKNYIYMGIDIISSFLTNLFPLFSTRNVFFRFMIRSPRCAHCRAMSDDWDTLADEYEGHPVALIAKVDCTSDDGQPICQDFDIQVWNHKLNLTYMLTTQLQNSTDFYWSRLLDDTPSHPHCVLQNIGLSYLGLWRSHECRNLRRSS